jgi:hypothetical protein
MLSSQQLANTCHRSASSSQRSKRTRAGRCPSRSSSILVRSPPACCNVIRRSPVLIPGNRQDSSRCEHGRVVQHRREGLHRVHGLQGSRPRSLRSGTVANRCHSQSRRPHRQVELPPQHLLRPPPRHQQPQRHQLRHLRPHSMRLPHPRPRLQHKHPAPASMTPPL